MKSLKIKMTKDESIALEMILRQVDFGALSGANNLSLLSTLITYDPLFTLIQRLNKGQLNMTLTVSTVASLKMVFNALPTERYVAIARHEIAMTKFIDNIFNQIIKS